MASGVSGYLDFLGDSAGITFRLHYEETYDASTNTSTVTPTKLQVKSTSWYGVIYYLDGTISIDGSVAVSMDSTVGDHSVYVTALDTFCDVSGTLSAVGGIKHNSDGSKSISIAVSVHGYTGDGVGYGNGWSVSDTKTVALTDIPRTFTLSISQGAGSTIMVKRNGTALSNGATITYGDVLTITFAAATGYNLGTHTVNGATFASGGTHTVTGAVAVAATARLKTFKLTISAGTGAIVSVKRNGTALSNGATLSYGDELTITFAAGTGYYLTETSHTSGETYTVTGAVTVSATAAVLSYLLSISQGEGTVISVTRTSSPKQGAAVGALSHGAAVYYSDVLEITITAKGGYKLSSATVNGSAFTSGNSHTVTGAVNVAAVAVLYAYLIGSGASQKQYVSQIKSGGTVKTYVGFIKRGGQWHPCGQ